jgi:hypothetical protein
MNIIRFLLLWAFFALAQYLALDVTNSWALHKTVISPTVDNIITIPSYLIVLIGGILLIPVSFPISAIIGIERYLSPICVYFLVPLVGAVFWTLVAKFLVPIVTKKTQSLRMRNKKTEQDAAANP